MTRKDYIITADALKRVKPNTNNVDVRRMWQRVVWSLKLSYELDNPKFDAAKFMQYCGYREE